LLAIGKIGSGIANLSLLISLVTKVGIRTYKIPRNSLELHPAPCMCDVCHVHGLGPSHTSKQNVLSLILLILLAKIIDQKRGIYGHRILYLLRLGPLFSNDAEF